MGRLRNKQILGTRQSRHGRDGCGATVSVLRTV